MLVVPGSGHVFWAFPPRRRRLGVIQAQPAGYHDQPATLVLDVLETRLHQTKEGFLYRVLGHPDVADDAEGQVDQKGAMSLPRPIEQVIGKHLRSLIFGNARGRPSTGYGRNGAAKCDIVARY